MRWWQPRSGLFDRDSFWTVVDRLGAAYNLPYLQGAIGDVVSLITDGTHAEVIAAIRARLARKFGLAVAA